METSSISTRGNVDALVCGSTLLACDLALRLAQRGQKTWLAMEGTNPYHEGISLLQPWIATEDLKYLSLNLQSVFEASQIDVEAGHEGRLYFNPGQWVKRMEDALVDGGVTFLYNSPVAGALIQEDRCSGVVFGGKTGLYAITARSIFDASAWASLAKTSGLSGELIREPQHYNYHVECSDVAGSTVNYGLKPTEQGAALEQRFTSSTGDKVRMKQHQRSMVFHIEMDQSHDKLSSYSDQFERLYKISLEAHDHQPHQRFRGAAGYLSDEQWRWDHKDPRYSSLVIVGPDTCPDNDIGRLILRDAGRYLKGFQSFFETLPALLSTHQKLPQAQGPFYFSGFGMDSWDAWRNHQIDVQPRINSESFSFQDPKHHAPRAVAIEMAFDTPTPSAEHEHVLLGAGTSGVGAALGMIEQKLSGICLEAGHECGGTHTLGGVSNLWMGQASAGFRRWYGGCGAKNVHTNAPHFWSALQGQQHLSLAMGCVSTGVSQRDRRVTGVFVLTPNGMEYIKGETFIDATGDGSIAAWAGADYRFGSQEDEMTLWGSFSPFFESRVEALRQFLSTVDERDPYDTSRFIYAMRRNRCAEDDGWVSPPFFVAPRESRHIKGCASLNYLDMIAGSKHPDTILRCSSNMDLKGIAQNPTMEMGLLSQRLLKRFSAHLPYGAMIPKDLDNLFVVGKAIDVCHETASMARMVRDMFSLGYIAATAMAHAKRQQVIPKAIDVKQLQDELIQKGFLSREEIQSQVCHHDDDLQQLLGFSDLEDSLAPSARLLLLRGPQKDELMNELEDTLNSDHQSIELADNPALLRWLGCEAHPKALDTMAALLWKKIEKDIGVEDDGHTVAVRKEVAKYVSPRRFQQAIFSDQQQVEDQYVSLPNHGFAMLDHYALNTLAIHRHPQLVPLLDAYFDHLKLDGMAMPLIWSHLYCLSHCALKQPSPKLLPRLHHILGQISALVPSPSEQENLKQSAHIEHEKLNYLRLRLLKALAKCSDPKALPALIEYLHHPTSTYARMAHTELVKQCQQDFGYDVQGWTSQLLERRPHAGHALA